MGNSRIKERILALNAGLDMPNIEIELGDDYPDNEVIHHSKFLQQQVILFEVIKNSIKATMEQHKDRLPTIKVKLTDSEKNNDVCIKISDEGGGIKRSKLEKVFTYLYTTSSPHAPRESANKTPLSGLGYGLPLSRLYARYFGGDLQILSMEGIGTDAYIHIKKDGNQSETLTPTMFFR